MSELSQSPRKSPVDLYRTRPELVEPLTKLLIDRVSRKPRMFQTFVKNGRRDAANEPLYVLEPGCYDGPFLKAFDKHWQGAAPLYLTGVDSEPKPKGFANKIAEYEQLDYINLTDENKELLKSEVIIGNPPFSLAEKFLRTSMELLTSNGRLGLLLQAGFLGSRERVKLFEEFKPWEIFILAPRPGFIRAGQKNGKDAREYVFVTWRKFNPSVTQFHWFDWKEQ